MLQNEKVSVYYGTKEAYEFEKQYKRIDENALYFIEGVLYSGYELYSQDYKKVSNLPDVGQKNYIYINTTNSSVTIWDEKQNEWIYICKPINNSAITNDDSSIATSSVVYKSLEEANKYTDDKYATVIDTIEATIENSIFENNLALFLGTSDKYNSIADITNVLDSIQTYMDEAGSDLELSIDPLNYVMTLALKNSKGVILSKKNVDVSKIVSGLVKDSLTIAGIDMKDNVTTEELSTALDLGNKANKNNLEYAGSLKGNGATVREDYKSVSLGGYNTSIGQVSFASGSDNNVSGNYATAQGYNCYVSGGYASAAGRYLLVSSIDQRVEGRFNVEDTQNQYAYILGNGQSTSSRNNAYTVDWNGNATYSGFLTAANFKGIANNFLTDNENMAAAAPLVKQLYEENQSLKSRISTLESGAFARERYSNIYIGQTHTYTDLNGQYLMVFSQNGAWKTLCGLAFANIVAYDNGCVVHPICGGVFDRITITTSANTITIEGNADMGANTTVRFYKLK